MNSGVELFNDFASFHDQNILKIGKEFVYSKSFLVAVGTKPRKLSFQASNQIITSDEAFDIKKLPKKFSFLVEVILQSNLLQFLMV